MLTKSITAEDLHVACSGRPIDETFQEQLADKYHRHGCALLKGLFTPDDLLPTQKYIERLVGLRAQHAQLVSDATAKDRFDDGFLALNQQDRHHGSVIFDACRRLLPLHVLSVDPRLIAIAQALMETETIIASDVKAIRVDQPDEDKYLFNWHQDYPFIMDSEDAIVFWIPLHDVDDHNGCLRVAVGSHKLGILPMRVNDKRNAQNNKQKFMEIATPSCVDDFPQITVPAELGDVLVFSTLTMHCSQPNRSQHTRWTAQIRFGNFCHPNAVKRDWPGSLRDGSWFDEKHPEYIVNPDDD